MLNPKFKEKFPIPYKYFQTLLDLVDEKKAKFPQALIFEGNDTIGQYLFALELAKNLNCLEDKDIECECLNCKWIKSHSHPCVNNVSQIHFKDEGDTTKTQISIKQAKKIINTLLLSSDYYRVFIFFSSNGTELKDEQKQEFGKFGYSDEINYSILPLEKSTFNEESINSLLKSVEEPNEKTLFIFLTSTKTNILPTIVSRCITFKFSKPKERLNITEFENLFSNYFSLNLNNVFDVIKSFSLTMQEKNIGFAELMFLFLEYLENVLMQNLDNPSIQAKIENDINIVNTALKQQKAKVSEKNILEEMFLRISRGF